MWPVATDGECLSVCLSVWQSWALQKWLNRSRCCLGCGPVNHVLDGVQVLLVDVQFWRGKGTAHCKVWGLFRALCKNGWTDRDVVAVWDAVGPRKCVLDGVDIGATRRIQLSRPCAAALWPYVKLLWPLVFSTHGVICSCLLPYVICFLFVIIIL